MNVKELKSLYEITGDIKHVNTMLVNLGELRNALADADRYDWLFNARTEDECNDPEIGNKPTLKQDEILAEISCWYNTKFRVSEIIDEARKS